MKRIFITGIAGFIGYHLAQQLQNQGHYIAGCDNFDPYYDPELKKLRAKNLQNISIYDADIRDLEGMKALIEKEKITHLVHLAAQPGVRASITHPQNVIDQNINGFAQILELCRAYPDIKLTYASSSSIYGLNTKQPFSESDPTDHPSNLYGASKKSNELMAHAYHHLYGISVTALRFFTVYGPWGRPDMAYFSFAKAIDEQKPIRVFNHGKMERDFTYIDDIILGIEKAIDLEGKCEIFNLGNNRPEPLMKLVHTLEDALGKKAIIEFLPMQKGEVLSTFADIDKSQKVLGFTPKTSLENGILKFVQWYSAYRASSTLQTQ